MGACSCDEAERFDILSQKTVRARKQHRCCECHRTIEPGEHYENIRGVCCGEMVIMKTCPFCVRVRDDLVSMHYCVVYEGLWELVGQIEREEV